MIRALILLDCKLYLHPYLYDKRWNTEDEALEDLAQVEKLELFGVLPAGGQKDVSLVYRFVDDEDPVNNNLAQLPPANHTIWWVDPRINK
ncbi:hypothetical protein KBZ18_10285 [Synechococcus sp. Cruz-9H2]|uniref:hypothetical protein n=1 Tax=unclassified Synechococcus TaxID=2626047 RepID=UPI0020CEBF75|nr:MULTISPECIES: hypothetical protein [unclassified Synechococcus]MCP9819881.1 hypothetical protein [Synechococcus sp. Cruz-9H2]MCP9844053.1 hypothetical protein [Synechococcus sp. Edmonson 11F2]MCP9856311.1 hypothetical protein [Synechococcus sp. Cruz-9C9]MCP9863596.1 hypothetical protein [Synechococcus sp. Cruz-7E5]MCP9870792.1 hypothetical protein [Synechococcus sp. Cruz-7B9]